MDGQVRQETAKVVRPSFQIMYSCVLCGVHRRKLNVKGRGMEDVGIWMNEVVREISSDHISMSPFCTSRTITELIIPIEKTLR